MSAGQAATAGAGVALTLFAYAPGWVRSLRARRRPEPLAPYRMPYGKAVGE